MLHLYASTAQLLLRYSEYINDRLHFPQKGSHKQKFEYAQEFWLKDAEKPCLSTYFKHTLQGAIDASAGSSGFIMPDQIKQGIQNDFDPSCVVEYSSALPDEKLVKGFTQYCQEESIVNQEIQLEANCFQEKLDKDALCVILGYGTHYLLQLGIKSLCKSLDDVIAITTPTYGLFLEPIEKSGASFWKIPLETQNNYTLNANELASLIKIKNESLKNLYFSKIKERLDFSEKLILKKDLPTWQKTKKTLLTLKAKDNTTCDALVNSLNAIIKSQKSYQDATRESQALYHIPLCPRVRAFLNINPQAPTGVVLDQNNINQIANTLEKIEDLHVIDDLTHRGIYLENVQTGTFAKTSMAHRTITLISFSKSFGLAGMRAGIAFANKMIAQAMSRTLFREMSMVAISVTSTLQAIFNMPKIERDAYLDETNAEYKFRLELVRAMVYGINTINPKIKKEIEKYLLTLKDISPKIRSQITEGIEGLTLNKPQGGFFVLLDFSSFKGRYLGKIELQTSMSFRNAFYHLADLNSIPGEMNYEFDTPQIRFCLTLSREEIIESLLRIKGVLSLTRDYPLLENAKSDTLSFSNFKNKDNIDNKPLEKSSAKKRRNGPLF